MDQCLRDLFLKGLISLEDAIARCNNKDELMKMINTPSVGSSMGPGGSAGPSSRGR
jgi:twitching motility protein PilT